MKRILQKLFHKSGLLLLFYIISFVTIRVGVALLAYRTDGLIALEMIDDGGGDGDREFIRNLLIGVIILLLISAWNVIDHWVLNRKKECYVRTLCGTSKSNLLLWLGTHYLSIILVACAATQLFCFILSKSKFFLGSYLSTSAVDAIAVIGVFILVSILMGAVKYKIGLGKHWLVVRYAIFGAQMIVAAWLVLTITNTYVNNASFSKHVEQVEENLSNVEYAVDSDPSILWPDATDEQFRELDRFFVDITDGQCFSFYEGNIVLPDIKNPQRYGTLEKFDHQYYIPTLYISDLYPSIYEWSCFDGELFTKDDYDIDGKQYIPILVGYDYAKDYSVGDVIGDSYQIRGILSQDMFYLNPRWEGSVYDLDKTIVLPLACASKEWGGAYLNQLHIISQSQSVRDAICDKVREAGLPEITFRSMSDQLQYIKDDVTFQLRFFGTSAFALLLLCFSSQTCMMLFLVDLRKREYCIRMICGASYPQIALYMAWPVFFIIVASFATIAALFSFTNLIGFAIPTVIVFSGIIMAAPFIKLYREPIIQSLRCT